MIAAYTHAILPPTHQPQIQHTKCHNCYFGSRHPLDAHKEYRPK